MLRPRDGAPNIVMIVLDDLGFAQLSCYGSDIATPNIDSLATQGLRYNNFHVTAMCSPTRAALLTGRNHHAVGMGTVTHLPVEFPGHTCQIPKSAATLPRILRDAGYNTLAVGKWHLTPASEISPTGPFDRWPLGMGFEHYYGFLSGHTNQWTPDLVQDNSFIEQPYSPYHGYHLTEDLASQAIRLVQDQTQTSPSRPFFLYFAPGAMHTPHQVPNGWRRPYLNQFNEGWDAWRHRTFLRQQKSGIVPPNAILTDRPAWVQRWDELSSKERHLYALMMANYAGFLTHTDAQIGRLLDFLSEIEVVDNTIVIFLSDNGASGEGGPNGWFNKMGDDTVDYDDSVDFMLAHAETLGGFHGYHHYPWGWAWAGNTPFRLWKLYSWLGGVRVPLVVRWPTGIPVEHSSEVRTQFCHAVDLMPTILDSAGVDPPPMIDGVSQQPFDGKSIQRTFHDADCPSLRRTQYFEVEGSRAIYHEGWKATTDHVVTTWKTDRERIDGSHDFDTDQWSLYCLDDDFSESRDVSGVHPARLRQMIELWWSEADRNDALPLIDGTKERMTLRETPPPVVQRRYTYVPKDGLVVTPPPCPAGFVISAHIQVPENQTINGVICAQGDWNSGWSCYAHGGTLLTAIAMAGTSYRLTTAERLDSGDHKIRLEYLIDPDDQYSFRCSLDGLEIGQIEIPSAMKTLAQNGFRARLSIGKDRGFPVREDYRPPFIFTGRINSVHFKSQLLP
ncbi:arylsulfatase [Amycolatopsis alkalitolerans]|uniref:Arylsulfatase n=2 Tax=Amycolatopsis alkalitolerans TaxID=2547244 RepID=A0A5C4LTD7_9PSEU|nr:arylsulfatase [Amycolatopsis alkalitolerans]